MPNPRHIFAFIILQFLQARQALLAEETNRRMTKLLHGEDFWLKGEIREPEVKVVPGGISSEEEEQQFEALRHWMEQQSLPTGKHNPQ